MTPYQTTALAELEALGRQLDAAAKQGSDATVLDPLLADMRHLHQGITDHLADGLGPPRSAATPARPPAALRAAGHALSPG
ncbi:hypothetical protein [Kitasatospora sp. GAS1066B]|uniref:hypothetical protein n=1 Tax=Kitasatospora sp. GAS1066B TaxID=3156271 RepID=UPI0035160697